MAHFDQVFLVQTGEDRNGEELHWRIPAAFDGGSHDLADCVDSQEGRTRFGGYGYGSAHRFPNVVVLHIQKDLLAAINQAADVVHAGSGIEFHAHFVESGIVAQSSDKGIGFRF